MDLTERDLPQCPLCFHNALLSNKLNTASNHEKRSRSFTYTYSGLGPPDSLASNLFRIQECAEGREYQIRTPFSQILLESIILELSQLLPVGQGSGGTLSQEPKRTNDLYQVSSFSKVEVARWISCNIGRAFPAIPCGKTKHDPGECSWKQLHN